MPSTFGIEQFGDSTTNGLTCINSAVVASQTTSPDQIHLDGNAKWPGRVIIYNRGVPGSVAADLLNGTPSFSDRMTSSSAQVVTFNYGMNESLWSQGIQQYASNIDRLVKIAKNCGKVVVLLEPNPTTNPMNTDLGSYVEALNSIALANQVMIIPHHRIWMDCNFHLSMLSDGTHPTKDGYVFKGHTEFQYMLPMMSNYLSA